MAEPRQPWWRRRWIIVTAGLILLLLVIGALSGDPDDATERAARGGDKVEATATPTPTPDPAAAARSAAASSVKLGDYPRAIAVLEEAGLATAAERVRRRGVRTLLSSAHRALENGRYQVAKARALAARGLARTPAVQATLAVATDGIARERAEARERRRQARIARDLRTCDAVERDSVRAGGGIPPGCTAYAAELDARRAEEEAEVSEPAAGDGCAPGYSPCIPPYPPDLDCPDVGPVTVTGSDPHGLDADGDGVACGGD